MGGELKVVEQILQPQVSDSSRALGHGSWSFLPCLTIDFFPPAVLLLQGRSMKSCAMNDG